MTTQQNILSRKELERRLFLTYGKCIQLNNDIETFNINSEYKFIHVNPTLKYIIKEFKQTVANLLYRNYYWIEDDKTIGDIYEKFIELDEDYVKNDKIIFKIPVSKNNEIIFFKPTLINPNTNHIVHYFDNSYFINNYDSPRELLKEIIKYFETNHEYTLEYYDCFDILS